MRDPGQPERQGRAGFSAIEAVVSTTVMLVVLGGAVFTTNAFLGATNQGRRNVEALGSSARATDEFSRDLVNATIPDPESDLLVFDANDQLVPGLDSQGRSVAAAGVRFRLRRHVNVRLSEGQVKRDLVWIEYRLDTGDLNHDGRTDQLLRIVDPDGARPRVQVAANRVLGCRFRRLGPAVDIELETMGASDKTWAQIQAESAARHIDATTLMRQYARQVKQHQRARPRNF